MISAATKRCASAPCAFQMATTRAVSQRRMMTTRHNKNAVSSLRFTATTSASRTATVARSTEQHHDNHQWAMGSRFLSTSATQDTKPAEDNTNATATTTTSSFTTVPIPSGRWPLVGHLPRLMQGGDSIVNWQNGHDECGDIFEMHLPGKTIVVTQNPTHAHAILMNQGRDTVRTPQHSWRAVFDLQGWPYGIPFAEGDAWKRRRKVLAETLLQTKHAKHYVPQVAPIADHWASAIAQYMVADKDETTTTKQQKLRLTQENASFRDVTSLFALQAVMKVVIGRQPPNVLSTPNIDADAVHFSRSVQDMFTASTACENVPWNVSLKLKPFRDLQAAWQSMYAYPSRTLQPILDYHKQHGRIPDDCQGTVLPLLVQEMEQGRLTEPEVLSVGVQAIAAAVDTTAQTMEYVLYNIATRPEWQQRLYEAVRNVVGDNDNLSVADLTVEQYESSDMDFIKAVVKESMRLTPTIGVHARTLTNDMELEGGYQLKQGQLVLLNYLSMSHNPDLYPRPDEFRPERFMKTTTTSTNDGVCPMSKAGKTAAIPFGHGGRKCTGKGFAELDLHLAIMALVLKYQVTYDGPPLVQFERQLLRPKTPLNPHFVFSPRD